MLPPSAMWPPARRVKLSCCTKPINPYAHPNSRIMLNGIFTCVVDDIVLADRVCALDGQASISVEAHPGSHGRLERIALLARQAMVVAGRVHVEATVQ